MNNNNGYPPVPPGPAFAVELWDLDQLRVKSFVVATFEEVQNIRTKYKQNGLYIVKHYPTTVPNDIIEE
jgi:hypothetical protein